MCLNRHRILCVVYEQNKLTPLQASQPASQTDNDLFNRKELLYDFHALNLINTDFFLRTEHFPCSVVFLRNLTHQTKNIQILYFEIVFWIFVLTGRKLKWMLTKTIATAIITEYWDWIRMFYAEICTFSNRFWIGIDCRLIWVFCYVIWTNCVAKQKNPNKSHFPFEMCMNTQYQHSR